MFQDYTDWRCEKRARVLYALATGMKELEAYVSNILFYSTPITSLSLNQSQPPAIFPSLAPMIYKSCLLYNQSVSANLEFTETRGHELESLAFHSFVENWIAGDDRP